MTRAEPPEAVPVEIYSRLTRDLRRNGVTVVVDLCGEVLEAALEGGVDLLKVSDEELAITGEIPDTSTKSVIEGMMRLRSRGATAVVVTRANLPILASIGDALHELRPPAAEPVDDRGAGDSVTAGITAASEMVVFGSRSSAIAAQRASPVTGEPLRPSVPCVGVPKRIVAAAPAKSARVGRETIMRK